MFDELVTTAQRKPMLVKLLMVREDTNQGVRFYNLSYAFKILNVSLPSIKQNLFCI